MSDLSVGYKKVYIFWTCLQHCNIYIYKKYLQCNVSYFLICQGSGVDTSASGGSGALHTLPDQHGVVPFNQNLC